MKKITLLIQAVILGFLIGNTSAWATDSNEVLQKIDQLASLPLEKTRGAEWCAIAENIEANSADLAKYLAEKVDDKALGEQQRIVYIWALGRTRDVSSLNVIIKAYQQHDSSRIRKSSLDAMANIGGNEAGDFILSTLDHTTDKNARFEVFNLLAQLQYKPALSRMDEVLKTGSQDFWQAIFVFGKMGRQAVPLLLQHMDSPDPAIRRNSIDLLGRWLVPEEAVVSMENRFMKEPDEQIRGLLIASLQRIQSDPAKLYTFVDQVSKQEKSEKVLKLIGDTRQMFRNMEAHIGKITEQMQPSAEKFSTEYESLYKSAGKKGDYRVLMSASTYGDEPKLEKLRERILQRNSDEAFHDYQKINNAILFNRLRHALNK